MDEYSYLCSTNGPKNVCKSAFTIREKQTLHLLQTKFDNGKKLKSDPDSRGQRSSACDHLALKNKNAKREKRSPSHFFILQSRLSAAPVYLNFKRLHSSKKCRPLVYFQSSAAKCQRIDRTLPLSRSPRSKSTATSSERVRKKKKNPAAFGKNEHLAVSEAPQGPACTAAAAKQQLVAKMESELLYIFFKSMTCKTSDEPHHLFSRRKRNTERLR